MAHRLRDGRRAGLTACGARKMRHSDHDRDEAERIFAELQSGLAERPLTPAAG